MEDVVLTKLLINLEEFKSYLKNGQSQEAKKTLESIKMSYYLKTGKEFEKALSPDKIEYINNLLEEAIKGDKIGEVDINQIRIQSPETNDNER